MKQKLEFCRNFSSLPAPALRDFCQIADLELSCSFLDICFRSPGFAGEKVGSVFPRESEFGVVLEPENNRVLVVVCSF